MPLPPNGYEKELAMNAPKFIAILAITQSVCAFAFRNINAETVSFGLSHCDATSKFVSAYAFWLGGAQKIVNELKPAKVALLDATLKVQDGFMRKDNAIKIQYAAKYATIANSWKKWIGETKGLKKSDAVSLKRKFETEFQEKVSKAGKQAEYGKLLSDFEKNYSEIKDYALARDYFTEVALRNTEILAVGYKLYQLEQILSTKGDQEFTTRKNTLSYGIDAFYRNYNAKVDRNIFEQLINLYATKSPKQFLPASLNTVDATKLSADVFDNSKLTSLNGFKELLTGDTKTVIEKINNDKGYLLIKSMADTYTKDVLPKFDELNLKNTATQRTFMKAILELFPKNRNFPDANSTLRVTYGKIKGYQPSDAVYYQPFSYLDGVMEKYIPGDYEFDVPKKLIDLYNAKDYGIYGVKGKMPVCFIGTNHTTGGNSGSPAIDAKGNLIGLNFDRVWEGTMSDIYYSPAICRNIMVDLRYVLFIIDKYAGAKNIINELKIITSTNKK